MTLGLSISQVLNLLNTGLLAVLGSLSSSFSPSSHFASGNFETLTFLMENDVCLLPNSVNHYSYLNSSDSRYSTGGSNIYYAFRGEYNQYGVILKLTDIYCSTLCGQRHLKCESKFNRISSMGAHLLVFQQICIFVIKVNSSKALEQFLSCMCFQNKK